MKMSINKTMKGISHSNMGEVEKLFPIGTKVEVLINEEILNGTIVRYPEKHGLFLTVKINKMFQQLPFNIIYV